MAPFINLSKRERVERSDHLVSRAVATLAKERVERCEHPISRAVLQEATDAIVCTLAPLRHQRARNSATGYAQPNTYLLRRWICRAGGRGVRVGLGLGLFRATGWHCAPTNQTNHQYYHHPLLLHSGGATRLRTHSCGAPGYRRTSNRHAVPSGHLRAFWPWTGTRRAQGRGTKAGKARPGIRRCGDPLCEGVRC